MNMKALILLVCLGWLSAPICSSVVSTIATTSSPKVTTLATVLSNSTATTLLPTGTTTTEASCTANNGTCGNVTTSAPNVKGSSRKEKWKNEPMQPSYYKFKMSNRSDCDCDLRNRFCDINCCCDKDCSLENKQVFSFCQDSINLPRPNSRYCNYMQYIYNNRTLYEEEVHQNSLFCIAKTNLPAHYYKQKKKIILQPLHANIVIKESSSYQWSNERNYEENFLEKNGNLTNRTAVFGDSIYVLKNYSNPQKLELVANFITPDCTTTKPVHYVQNLKTTCRQTLNEHNSQLFLRYFKSNWTTIASLRFLNTSLQNYEGGCPKNVCIPFNLKQCNLYTCWNLSNTTTSACTTKMCTNIVTKVKYTFVHNGTHGIQGADLSLTLENITLPTSSIDQEYEVKFLWINQTEFNYTNYRSGNPGYQINKPILFAKLITVINATTNSTTNKTIYQKTQYLKRPALNYIENFLVLPKNVQGKCLLSPFLYENLNFGYNMLTKCIHGQGFVKVANTTANDTCWLLQNNILAYWSLDVDQKQHKNTTSNTTFGYFGNAQNENLKDWGHFLFDMFPEELLNKTYGQDIDNNSIACQNISTGIKYNVFYERVEHEQNRISAIYVEFVHLHRVDLHVLNGNVFSDVALHSEVMFYDVTGVRNRKYVDPPSLDIKLPHDFFYPFIKVENRALSISSCSVNIIFVLSVLVKAYYTNFMF